MVSLLKIQEAISKNVCPPDENEEQNFSIPKSLRASISREGDSQLAILLFVGIATDYGYSPADIKIFLNIRSEEFKYKLSKYKRKSRSNDVRFINKILLVKNYLRFKYNA
jgi:hypothetical protein